MTKDRKTVTLIIPAHNEENYILKCLEHALSYGSDFIDQIIVVDNASSDQTYRVVHDLCLSQNKIKLIYENNKGVQRARQAGYMAATGELLAFIDADTQMPPGWVERIQAEFSDEKLGFLSGPYDYYDFGRSQKVLNKVYCRFIMFPMYLIFGYVSNAGNFVIRKEVLDEMGGFDTTIEFYGDDTNTARRAKELSKVKFSLDFVMFTSARRIKQQGVISTVKSYGIAFFSEAIFHKTYIKKYKDYR